jgi:hypothetical protein
MITREQLREHLGRRPFVPFRVTMTNGEFVDVVRTAQGAATTRQFIVGTEQDRLKWIELNQIERVDVFQLPRAAP